jgi:hypothetical protein
MGKQQPIEIQRDEKRVALTAAIAERVEADRIAAAARVALGRAERLHEDAQSHANAISAALASVRNGHAARLRAAAEGGDVVVATVSSRDQRAAEIDALDELGAAKAVLAGCQASAAEADDNANRAQRRVEAASLPVLAAEVDRLLAEAAAIHDTLEAKLAGLDFVNALLIPGSPERKRIALTRPPLPPGIMPADRRGHPAFASWREAHSELMRNAYAPLPA